MANAVMKVVAGNIENNDIFLTIKVRPDGS